MKIILYATLLLALFACKETKPSQETENTMAPKTTTEIVVEIDGMTCAGCENTIESTIANLENVVKVKASYSTGNAIISLQDNTIDTLAIAEKINESGYSFVSLAVQE
jgi:copper chaperone CopZ